MRLSLRVGVVFVLLLGVSADGQDDDEEEDADEGIAATYTTPIDPVVLDAAVLGVAKPVAAVETSGGELLIATSVTGKSGRDIALLRQDAAGDIIDRQTHDEGADDDVVIDIARAGDGTIWVASSTGASCFLCSRRAEPALRLRHLNEDGEELGRIDVEELFQRGAIVGLEDGGVALHATSAAPGAPALGYVTRINSDAEAIWTVRTRELDSVHPTSIIALTTGEIVAAGIHYGDVQLGDQVIRSSDVRSVYLAMFDADGALLRTTSLRADSIHLAPLDDGDLIAAGSFDGAPWVRRFDVTFEQAWGTTFASRGEAVVSDVEVVGDGVIVLGSTTGALSSEEAEVDVGRLSLFLATLNPESGEAIALDTLNDGNYSMGLGLVRRGESAMMVAAVDGTIRVIAMDAVGGGRAPALRGGVRAPALQVE